MKILFPYMARWHAVNWSRYHSLLYALADRGHEVHVLQPPSLRSDETNFQEIKTVGHLNIHVHDVSLNRWLWERRFPFDKLFKKAFFSLASLSDARRLAREEGIDLLLLYNIPQYRFSAINDVSVVFDYADDYVDMLSFELGSLDNPIARSIARKMLRTMMKRASVTLCVSNVLAEQAVGKVHVLPNGVSLEKAAAPPAVSIQEVKSNNRPVVGFLGAFEYFINLDLVVDIAKSMPDLHFLLVGTGRGWKRVAERLERESIPNVQLTGGVPHDQVFAYIRKMDICLNTFAKLPVSHRACPIKLFEYLSQRKPVVSTRLDELSYIDDGILWYADTLEESCEVIREILARPDEAVRRSERGYQLTASTYTWGGIAVQFEELLRPIVRSSAK